MNLIIVESPTKARTLGRFLGKEYKIGSSMGHVRDLPKSKLGVDVKNDFAPEYVVVEKRKDTIAQLQKDAKKAKEVYLATDPDREGEAIAYHVKDVLSSNSKLKIKNSKFSRIVFHEITRQAVEKALEHPGSINLQLFHAQQARRVLDRLVGYKLSPLLWRKVRTGLSAGRVQSVVVRLIVERDREIEAFRAEEYWEIFAELKIKNQKLKIKNFIARLVKIGEKKAEIKNEKQAKPIVADLEKANYKVASIDKREVLKRPYPPFTTSTMTQAANRLFGWSARRIMFTAQKLYERGLITYHRTDSTNMAIQAVNSARRFIQLKYGDKYIPQMPRFYKTRSRSAQEAHEAIRPTDVRNTQYAIRNTQRRDEVKLYDLIWKRFVACQMADAVLDETTIGVKATTSRESRVYELRAQGQVTKFPGWRRIYGDKKQVTSNKKNNESRVTSYELLEVSEGEPLYLIKVLPEQKFTLPPPRYTEASLVKMLEKLGIGRPSTYAPIISTIQTRQYVEKVEGKFHSTPLGVAVNNFLVANFQDIVDYKFTADMEDELDKIANGKRKWVPVMKDFWQPFSSKLVGVGKKAERVKVEVQKTGEKCPKCVAEGLPARRRGEQVIRVGRFGKFLSCSRFPDCDWTAAYTEKIGIRCPGCHRGDVVVVKTKKGRKFFGCSRFPECKWASWVDPRQSKGKDKT